MENENAVGSSAVFASHHVIMKNKAQSENFVSPSFMTLANLTGLVSTFQHY